MKRYLKYILPALVVAAVSWGVAEQRVDKTGSVFPMWVTGGLYVGPLSPNPTNSTMNKVTRIIGCKCDLDFPSIPSGYSKNNPNPCSCVGVRPGDPCSVGYTGPADGGTDLVPDGTGLECEVKRVDLVTIMAFNQLGDGGADDPQDAGFYVRVISQQ